MILQSRVKKSVLDASALKRRNGESLPPRVGGGFFRRWVRRDRDAHHADQAAPDSPPVLTGDPAPHLDENKTAVPGQYTATDPDGDLITWSLTGTDGASLRLVDSSAANRRTLQFTGAGTLCRRAWRAYGNGKTLYLFELNNADGLVSTFYREFQGLYSD